MFGIYKLIYLLFIICLLLCAMFEKNILFIYWWRVENAFVCDFSDLVRVDDSLNVRYQCCIKCRRICLGHF